MFYMFCIRHFPSKPVAILLYRNYTLSDSFQYDTGKDINGRCLTTSGGKSVNRSLIALSTLRLWNTFIEPTIQQIPRLKNLVCPTIYTSRKENCWMNAFLCEMPTTISMIGTRNTVSISHDDHIYQPLRLGRI